MAFDLQGLKSRWGRGASASLWRPLQEGDTVDIIAPGSATSKEVLENGMRVLASWGLEPRAPRKIFGRDVLCASDDTTRAKHLRDALLDTDSRAIWCMRGGYGSLRLIPELAKVKRPGGAPKLFIGLSDITSLSVFLNQEWNWPTVHGPLLDRFAKGLVKPAYAKEFKRFIFGEMPAIEFPKLKPMNAAARKTGSVKGPVSGGNLIVLQSTLGTKGHWDPKGRILFFEEIGERGYKVDRVLEQFRQMGFFDQAKAVVLGDFTEGLEPDGSTRVPAVLKRFAESVKIPVLSGIKSGHAVVQRPLPLGTSSVLHLGASPKLVCQTGADL